MMIRDTNFQTPTEPGMNYIPCYRLPFLSLFHADCMEIMKQYPDKYFDLAIVDPPYGAVDKMIPGGGTSKLKKKMKWDISPNKSYFDELLRVSKNQIIWGGNYFADKLPISTRYICWYKTSGNFNKMPEFELAWTSTNVPNRIFTMARCDSAINKRTSDHPTEKPVDLYDWTFSKYATEGMKILDTHFGSGNIALAVDKANRLDKMNLHLTACEIDKEYIDKAIKRISESIKQGTLSF